MLETFVVPKTWVTASPLGGSSHSCYRPPTISSQTRACQSSSRKLSSRREQSRPGPRASAYPLSRHQAATCQVSIKQRTERRVNSHQGDLEVLHHSLQNLKASQRRLAFQGVSRSSSTSISALSRKCSNSMLLRLTAGWASTTSCVSSKTTTFCSSLMIRRPLALLLTLRPARYWTTRRCRVREPR